MPCVWRTSCWPTSRPLYPTTSRMFMLSHILTHLHLFTDGTVLKHFPQEKKISVSFQLVYLFLSSVESITIAGLGNWHNRKRKSYSRYAKVTGAICFNVLRFKPLLFSSPSPIFPQDAFQCFQDLKRIYLVCYRLLSSHCNAHAVNDSIFTGWLIDGNLKEKNNHGACFTFHQSNYIKTHTQKRDWSLTPFLSHSSLLSFLHPIFVCFPPLGNFDPLFQSF